MRNKIAYTIVRILTGLVFVVFGAMKFFPAAMSAGPAITGKALAFMTGLAGSGYFIPFLGLVEVVIGLMLLFNLWSAFATIMLVPVSLNIFLFDVLLMPSGWIIGVFPLLFNIYLLIYNWEKYKPIFKK